MDNNVSNMIMVKQWYGVMVQHVWFAMDPGKICCCEDFIVALIYRLNLHVVPGHVQVIEGYHFENW